MSTYAHLSAHTSMCLNGSGRIENSSNCDFSIPTWSDISTSRSETSASRCPTWGNAVGLQPTFKRSLFYFFKFIRFKIMYTNTMGISQYPNVRFYLQFGCSWKLFVALYIEVIPLFLCTWKLFLCCYGEQIKFSVK